MPTCVTLFAAIGALDHGQSWSHPCLVARGRWAVVLRLDPEQFRWMMDALMLVSGLTLLGAAVGQRTVVEAN